MTLRLLVAIALALVLVPSAAAQEPAGAGLEAAPVMLVVDVSGSMDEDDGAGTRKIEGAQLALLDYVGSVEPSVKLGLHTYPDQQSGADCNGGKLAIGVGPADPERMSAQIRKLRPDGDTPTAEALRKSVDELKAAGETHGTLVLVSDGESTCDDPCKTAKDIAGEGFDLDAITVGFRISEEGRKELECISDAFDGRYLDIDESDELRDALDRLGRPKIGVELADESVELVAGGDYADVSATVTNSGQVEARDVIAQFGVAGGGFDVRRPVSRLGNLAPLASREVTWRVRAGPTAGASAAFTVVGRALNASAAGRAEGRLSSLGVVGLDQAGEILNGPGRGIAILGDSYSAGEGADAYFSGTDTKDNGCHRSPKTYLAPLYSENQVTNLACSGAVVHQVTSPDFDNHERSQISKLVDYERRAGPVKAAVLTIGGNDANFRELAESCIVGRRSCTDVIFMDHAQTRAVPRGDFVRDAFRDLGGRLESTYEAVHRALNGPITYEARGRDAPIMVLGYPIPVPFTGRSCAPMGYYVVSADRVSRTVYLVTADEIDFMREFATRLNALVEAAVENVRRSKGIPVFYVPTTEPAFQPRHTVCDSGTRHSSTEPFARSVVSINGGAKNRQTLIELAKPTLHPVQKATGIASTLFKRSIQELAHPNARGYEAETSAILRWSRSRAAEQASAFARSAAGAKEIPLPTWNVSAEDLGQLDGSSVQLQGGTAYPMNLSGFAPDARIEVVAHSRKRVLDVLSADAYGRVSTRVAIPTDLEDGDHVLEVSGSDPQGGLRTVRIPFEVDKPFRPPFQTATASLSGASLLLGIALLGLTGRLSRWRRWWGNEEES